MGAVIGRLAEGMQCRADELRLSRHARRCSACRRRARELGVEPLAARARVPSRAAVLLPLPWLVRRSGHGAAGADGGMPAVLGTASHVGSAIAERAATFLAAAAIAGAGGAAVAGGALDHSQGERPAAGKPAAAEVRVHHRSSRAAAPTSARRAAAPPADGGRADAPARHRAKGRERAAQGVGRTDAAAPGVALPAAPALPKVEAPAVPEVPNVPVPVPDPPEVAVPPAPPPSVELPPAPQASPPTVRELGGAVTEVVEGTLGTQLP
jgi:hypothetical protein